MRFYGDNTNYTNYTNHTNYNNHNNHNFGWSVILTLIIAAFIFGTAIWLIARSKNNDYVFIKGVFSIPAENDRNDRNDRNKIIETSFINYNVNGNHLIVPLCEVSGINIDIDNIKDGDSIDIAYKKNNPQKVISTNLKNDNTFIILGALVIFIFGIVCFWFINHKKGLSKRHGIAETFGSIVSIVRHI